MGRGRTRSNERLRIGLDLVVIAGVVTAIGGVFQTGSHPSDTWVLWLGIALLVMGVPRWAYEVIFRPKASSSDDAPIAPPALPTMPQPHLPPDYLTILQRDPSTWFTPPSANGPELLLRVAVALPEPPPMMYPISAIDEPTRLHGDARERTMVGVLESSKLTKWLKSLQPTWNWIDDPQWWVHGNTNESFTELRFTPSFAQSPLRSPLSARCAIVTGWLGRDAHGAGTTSAIVVVCDLMMCVLELDERRHPSSIRHQTTPPPVPGALSLEEVADYLQQLLTIIDLAHKLAWNILDSPTADHGQLAIWLTTLGQQLDRLIDLREFRRLPGSTGSGPSHMAGRLPLPADPAQSRRLLAVSLLANLLDRCGYRDTDAALDNLRQLPGKDLDLHIARGEDNDQNGNN